MAKDYDFEDDNLDNFDFGEDLGAGFETADDRTPESRLFGSIKASLSKNVFGTSFIKKTMRSALPEGFQSAMDAEEEISSELDSLYNNVGSQAAPVNKIIKRKTRQLLPSIGKYLPKALKDKLQEYSEESDYTPKSQGEYDAEEISSTLKDIFTTTVEEAARQRQEETAKGDVENTIEEKRFESSQRLLAAIRGDLQFNKDYLSNITYKFQQKSLELQYRQYFIARDQFALSRELAPLLREGLEKIAKNTSLPDIVKARGKEVFKAMAREGVIRNVQKRAVERMTGAVRRVGENAKNTLGQMVGDFRDNLEFANDSADSLNENIELMGGYSGLAGEIGGELAADSLAARLGKKLSGRVNKSERLRLLNARLLTAGESLPNAIRNYTESDVGERYNEDGSRSETLAELAIFTKKLLQGVGGERVAFSVGDESTLELRGVEWNMAAHRSLTEVIPGYLARILREQQIIRTGNENVELTTYNLSRSRFTDMSTKARDIARTIINKKDMETLRGSIKSTIEEVDREGKLSPKAREDLEKQLFIDSLSGYGMDVDRYIAGNRYSKGIGEESRTEISGLFKERYGEKLKDTSETRTSRQVDRARAIREFNEVRRNTPDVNEALARNVGLGNRATLEDLGFLVQRNGKSELNLDKLIHLATDDDLDYYSEDVDVEDDYYDYDPSIKNRRTKGPSRKRKMRAGLGRLKRNVKGYDYRGAVAGGISKGKDKLTAGASSARQTRDELLGRFNKAQADVTAGAGSIVENLKERQSTATEELYRQADSIVASVKAQQGKAADKLKSLDSKQLKDSVKEAVEEVLSGADSIKATATRRVSKLAKDLDEGSVAARRMARIRARKLSRAIKPIYSKARREAVLTKEGLMNGKYFDAVTRKPIAVLEDIQNAVVDISGRLLVSEADLEMGLVHEQPSVETVTETTAAIEAQSTSPLGNIGLRKTTANRFERHRHLLDTSKGIKDELTGAAIDVYVKGENTPRILGRKLRQGFYIDKASNKVITSIKDITGEVIDTDGRLVLSQEDFERGLTSPDRRWSSRIAALGIKGLGVIPKAYFKASMWYWKSLGKAAFKGISALGGSKDRLAKESEIVDLYVKGEEKPRLYAAGMAQGRYANQEDNSPIRRVGDIKGAVIDAEGNVIVNAKEVESLVTPNGTPIQRFVSGLKRIGIASVAMSLFGAPGVAAYLLWKGGKSLLSGGRKAFGALRNKLGKVLGRPMHTGDPVKDYELGMQRANVEATMSVAQLIADRFPAQKKRSFSDTDGDGLRDGSWQDILKRRRQAKEEQEGSGSGKDGEEGEGKQSVLGKMASFAWKELGIGAAAMSAWGAAKRFGAKAWQGTKRLAGRALSGTKNLAMRGLAALKSRAAGASWNTVKRVAVRQIGRMLLQRLVGAATLLTAKAAIIVGVVAATAVGGYLLYRKLFAKKASQLTSFRLMQYGVDLNNQEQVKAIMALEEKMYEHTRIFGDSASISIDPNDIPELASLFGIEASDEESVGNFADWLAARFKPVYLNFVKAAKAFGKERELVGLDEIGVEDKQKILESVHADALSKGVYNLPYGPSGDEPDAGVDEITAAYSATLEQYSEDSKGTKDKVKETATRWSDRIKGWFGGGKTKKETKAVSDSAIAKATGVDTATLAGRTPTKQPAANPLSVKGPTQTLHGSGDKKFLLPAAGKISSEYGERIHPVTGVKSMHKGIDIAGPTGTPVYAAASGTILYQQWMKGYGNVVWLKHPDGKISKYAHLSSFIPGLKPGMLVEQGDLIGKMGNTGIGTGPHLHFEVRGGPLRESPSFDPLQFIASGTKAVADVNDEKRSAKEILNSGADLEDDPSEGADTVVSTAQGKKTSASPLKPETSDEFYARRMKAIEAEKDPYIANRMRENLKERMKGRGESDKTLSTLTPEQRIAYDRGELRVTKDNATGKTSVEEIKPAGMPNVLASQRKMDISSSKDLTDQLAANQKLVEERRRAAIATAAEVRAKENVSKQVDSQAMVEMNRVLHNQLLTQINMDKTLIQTRDLLVEIRDLTGASGEKLASAKPTKAYNVKVDRELTNPVDLRKTR